MLRRSIPLPGTRPPPSRPLRRPLSNTRPG